MSSASTRVSRLIERLLLAIGCLLLLAYAGWQFGSFASSRVALWSFHARQLPGVVHAASAHEPDQQVDFALWSNKRIAAYKRSLAMKLDSPLAVVTVPRLGIEVPVFDGTDDLTLNRGAGRINGTAAPGQSGNLGIAAHRDGFFRGLKDIQVGDQVNLLADQRSFVYRVDDIKIVDPSDVDVLRPRDKPSVTLITCYPFYFVGDAPQRYIVHASLVEGPISTASSLNPAVQPSKSEDTP